MMCTVVLPDERRVRIAAVRLDHRTEDLRIRSAQEFDRLQDRADSPLVLAGDFNSTRPGYPYASPTPQGDTVLSVLLRPGGFATSAKSTTPIESNLTFPSEQPIKLIDWILASPPAKVESLRVLDLVLSDHRPVIARVSLGR